MNFNLGKLKKKKKRKKVQEIDPQENFETYYSKNFEMHKV